MGKHPSIVIAAIVCSMLCSRPARGQDWHTSLARFVAETDAARKERLLDDVTRFPAAGPHLLGTARSARDLATKWMSIRGLGLVGYKGAAPYLIEALAHDHPYVRASAVGALAEIGEKSAAPVMIELLGREKDGAVIEQTSSSLARLGAREAVPALKKVASHPSAQTRIWVMQAVGALGDGSDLPFLAEYLGDPDIGVAEVAAEGIEEITGQDFGFPRKEGPVSIEVRHAIERARSWWATYKAPR